MENKMDFQTFKKRIELLGVAYSIRDKVPYRICSVKGDVLTIQRESTENYVDISLKELYDYSLLSGKSSGRLL